jgi:hypothetical protein
MVLSSTKPFSFGGRSPQISESNVAVMPARRDQEMLLHVHHLIGHVAAQARTPAFSKEESRAQAELHPGQVYAQTYPGAGTKGVKCGLLCCRLRFCESCFVKSRID